MEALRKWTLSIITDVFLAGLLYLWIFRGVDGAGNVAMFIIWTVVILRIVVFVLADKLEDVSGLKRPTGFTSYNAITEIALVIFLVWFGLLATATAYFTSFLLFEAARKLILKNGKKKQDE